MRVELHQLTFPTDAFGREIVAEIVVQLGQRFGLSAEDALFAVNCFWGGLDLRDSSMLGHLEAEDWADQLMSQLRSEEFEGRRFWFRRK